MKINDACSSWKRIANPEKKERVRYNERINNIHETIEDAIDHVNLILEDRQDNNLLF
jgi:hypothetical protein